MKKLLIIALVLGGCNNSAAPLRITGIHKAQNIDFKGKCHYELNDDYYFYDNCNKYNIGDTIK